MMCVEIFLLFLVVRLFFFVLVIMVIVCILMFNLVNFWCVVVEMCGGSVGKICLFVLIKFMFSLFELRLLNL